MKFGIRAALQALLEADDQIGGKTLGESALTLVRRHRAAQESARTMCNGLEAARAQLAEAHQSEARALAELDKVRAQFRGLGFEFDDLLKERDALAAARDALEHQLADSQVRTGKVEAQLATVIAQYNATTLALADMHTLADQMTLERNAANALLRGKVPL